MVGHTPKNDHFIYDVNAEFARGNERIAVKAYRASKCGGNAKAIARQETANLQFVQQALSRKKLAEFRVRWATSAKWARWLRTKYPGCRCNRSS